jgi:hypothetical protein
MLAALLLAAGERASLAFAPGGSFVRVEIEPSDIARLPPYASPIARNGRYYLPLDARRARRPIGRPPRPPRPLIG